MAYWLAGAGLRIERSEFEPLLGHCAEILILFFGKILDSHSAALRPGVYMGTSKLSRKPDEMLGGYVRWTSIPSRRSSNTPSHFMLQKLG